MRSDRSPVPTRLRRFCAVSFCRRMTSASRRRALSSDIARARFLCCERSSWHSTTVPVGRCVMRMAESVLLTCWPPAPDARNVSMRKSLALISISPTSSDSGSTATVHVDVCTRPCASVSGAPRPGVGARLNLELRIRPAPDDAADDLLVAAVLARAQAQDLEVPPLPFGVAPIHAKQIPGEDRGFVAGRARANFQEQIGVVIGVLGDQVLGETSFERCASFP